MDVISNEKNGLVILHGQTKGGKSTSLFGDDKQKEDGVLKQSI